MNAQQIDLAMVGDDNEITWRSYYAGSVSEPPKTINNKTATRADTEVVVLNPKLHYDWL